MVIDVIFYLMFKFIVYFVVILVFSDIIIKVWNVYEGLCLVIFRIYKVSRLIY